MPASNISTGKKSIDTLRVTGNHRLQQETGEDLARSVTYPETLAAFAWGIGLRWRSS
jgi:hypothetical protein